MHGNGIVLFCFLCIPTFSQQTTKSRIFGKVHRKLQNKNKKQKNGDIKRNGSTLLGELVGDNEVYCKCKKQNMRTVLLLSFVVAVFEALSAVSVYEKGFALFVQASDFWRVEEWTVGGGAERHVRRKNRGGLFVVY